jgi:hypothetical protein
MARTISDRLQHGTPTGPAGVIAGVGDLRRRSGPIVTFSPQFAITKVSGG